MSDRTLDDGANQAGGPPADGGAVKVSSIPATHDGVIGTPGGHVNAGSSENAAAAQSTSRHGGTPAPDSAGGRVAETGLIATEAGVIAAKAVWSQAPTLIPLLAALSYGLGRLMVDGFYAQLHTTAEAAGLGYGSILEPAAILTAAVVAIGTAIAMAFDALKVVSQRLRDRRKRQASLLSLLVGIGATVAGIAILGLIAPIDILATLVPGVALPAVRTLVDKFGSAKDRDVGITRAEEDRSLSGSPRMSHSDAKRIASVILSLGFLAGLCFGAHELGAHEGKKAASGKPVDISVLGFDVSSITAIPVRVQPIESSPALDELTANNCWLEIGSGSSTVLLYDLADSSTLAIPSDQVIVINSNIWCRK